MVHFACSHLTSPPLPCRFSRETKKERLFTEKTIELQKLWNNPIPRRDEFDFTDATEEWLDEELRKANQLIRYEKRTAIIAKLLGIGVIALVAAGVIGLLIFGVRQIAPLF